MAQLGLPERLFKTGCEPQGRKKINGYFNLHWIKTINKALKDDPEKRLLAESQFSNIMQMGEHKFSVQFLHYLLTLQLKTTRKSELWWTFAGKPIRYAIEDFSLVTGLNCKPATKLNSKCKGEVWDSLFGDWKKAPTPKLIVDKLNSKCKSSLERFRLALLLIVEGILCPTCASTLIRPEVVEMLGDIEEFMKYPWGRESFTLTVKSVTEKHPFHYAAQESLAVQGFAHAMVLVTIYSCPSIIHLPILVREGMAEEEEVSVEEVLHSALAKKLIINVPIAKNLNKRGQAKVKALLVKDRWEESLRFKERPDLAVDNMLALIAEDYPFELNTWTGGVTEDEAKLQNPRNADLSDRIDETITEERTDDINEPVRTRRSANKTVENLDIPVLLRQMATVYEEKLLSMFEGNLRSLKELFGDLKGEIRDLKGEIRSMQSKGMYNREEEDHGPEVDVCLKPDTLKFGVLKNELQNPQLLDLDDLPRGTENDELNHVNEDIVSSPPRFHPSEKTSDVLLTTTQPETAEPSAPVASTVSERTEVFAESPVSETTELIAESPVSERTEVFAESPVSETTELIAESPVSETTELFAESPVSETRELIAESPVSETTELIAESPVSETTEIIADSPVSETTGLFAESPVSETTELIAESWEKTSDILTTTQPEIAEPSAPVVPRERSELFAESSEKTSDILTRTQSSIAESSEPVVPRINGRKKLIAEPSQPMVRRVSGRKKIFAKPSGPVLPRLSGRKKLAAESSEPTVPSLSKRKKLSAEQSEAKGHERLRIRQLYHSQTLQPMTFQELMSNEDSENESDDVTLDLQERLRCERVTGLRREQNRYMYLWNIFIRRQRVIADGHVPLACEEFTKLYKEELKRSESFDWWWRMFRIRLWNQGLICAKTFNNCTTIMLQNSDEAGPSTSHHPANANTQQSMEVDA